MKPLGLLFSPRLRRQFDEARTRNVELRRQHDDELEVRQFDAFKRIWKNAIEDVPYYADLVATGRAPRTVESWQDVRSLPVLSRAILQDQPHAFVRRSGGPDGITKTAGSTGTPLSIGMNQSERDLLRVVKLAAWQELGYDADSRVFIMWGHAHLLGAGLRGWLNHQRRMFADLALGYRRVNAYRLNPQACAEFAERLIAFQPSAFISYASALDLFARYTVHYRERFRALRLKFVLATTEPPPRPDTLALLRDLFGCPVVQEYGGGDFGQVAFHDGGDAFKVYGDLNYLETAGPDPANPASATLLVTSLYPRYLPLIRYRIGDAVTVPQQLPHGHVNRFGEVAGRLNDVIELDGSHIHSLAIFHCVHQEPSVYNIQMALYDDRIELRLVALVADRAALEARMRARLADVHPALARARFVYADDIQTTRAGKRRWFIDERTPSPCAESPAS